MSKSNATIVYTKTDEAPALATYSFLPIVERFCQAAGINIESRDISLAARILNQFPDQLSDDQKVSDDLAYLGDLAKKPEANIIKLPNISASIPQLVQAITELQTQGYKIPDWVPNPKNDAEKEIHNRYKKVLGSAVNPVLREGNSDRRVAGAVKTYAKDNPHSMGAWDKNSKTHVSSMSNNDFYSCEKSYISPNADEVSIEFIDPSGKATPLREPLPLLAGEIIDASMISSRALCAFYDEQIEDAKKQDVLFSLHLKATMMKVSDPIIFGYAVKRFYKEIFEKYADAFKQVNVNPNNGIGDVYSKIANLPEDQRNAIKADIEALYATKPSLAMVDSDKGITNLHVPSDVIIDASMPAMIRSSGKMWGTDGKLHDAKAVIPDRSYAAVYVATIDFCKEHGAFDVTTMGNVANVGLMAQKAQEYGSHDKTFYIEQAGIVRVSNQQGTVIFEHQVESGDVWRMSQTKDLPVRDWVKLAVNRARATHNPAIFWLDENRAHDRNLIGLVNTYLKDHDTSGLDIQIMSPAKATQFTLARVKNGDDTISVTGNIYRDYLTDLFPILELGTSAKMLSIVPLLAGGGLFETGAGGSAPKHVQQFLEEGHLRWDSLGEFLALAVSIEDIADKTGDDDVRVLANTLDDANNRFLKENKSPHRKVGELDTRGSHFYLALYWSQALAQQDQSASLKAAFAPLADYLSTHEAQIIEQLASAQGAQQDIGGYYNPQIEKAFAAMRPSELLNNAISSI